MRDQLGALEKASEAFKAASERLVHEHKAMEATNGQLEQTVAQLRQDLAASAEEHSAKLDAAKVRQARYGGVWRDAVHGS